MPHPLEKIGEYRGNTVYKKDNGVGGHEYWDDSIGGGLRVMDSCIHDPEALFIAIKDAWPEWFDKLINQYKN